MFGYEGSCWQQNVSKFLSSFSVIPRGSSITQLAHVTDILTFINAEERRAITNRMHEHEPVPFTSRIHEFRYTDRMHEGVFRESIDEKTVSSNHARSVYSKPAYRLSGLRSSRSMPKLVVGRTEALINHYLNA